MSMHWSAFIVAVMVFMVSPRGNSEAQKPRAQQAETPKYRVHLSAIYNGQEKKPLISDAFEGETKTVHQALEANENLSLRSVVLSKAKNIQVDFVATFGVGESKVDYKLRGDAKENERLNWSHRLAGLPIQMQVWVEKLESEKIRGCWISGRGNSGGQSGWQNIGKDECIKNCIWSAQREYNFDCLWGKETLDLPTDLKYCVRLDSKGQHQNSPGPALHHTRVLRRDECEGYCAEPVETGPAADCIWGDKPIKKTTKNELELCRVSGKGIFASTPLYPIEKQSCLASALHSKSHSCGDFSYKWGNEVILEHHLNDCDFEYGKNSKFWFCSESPDCSQLCLDRVPSGIPVRCRKPGEKGPGTEFNQLSRADLTKTCSIGEDRRRGWLKSESIGFRDGKDCLNFCRRYIEIFDQSAKSIFKMVTSSKTEEPPRIKELVCKYQDRILERFSVNWLKDRAP